MKKKTEVRVKRTTFYAVHSNGVIAWLFSKKAGVKDRVPVVAIDRRDLAALEARLAAAEAENKRLRKENAALKAEQDGRRHRQCFNCGRSPASAMDD